MGRGALVGAFILALATTDCGGGPVALYEGPPQDQSQIAVIRRSAVRNDLRVFRIDSRATRGREWHVTPGAHRIWMELVQYGTAMNVRFKGHTYCAIDFSAQAGGDYRIVSRSEQRPGIDTLVTLGVELVDAADRSVAEQWECFEHPPK